MILRTLWRHWFKIRMPRTPVVVVLGATGCGKSQLAIEIARKYNGEVISADSMQVYKNLDITTNKVTPEEMAGVPHHLLDFVEPTSSFTVVDFRNRALPIVERLRKAGKLPVIVGGTNYYIESILWDTLINPEDLKDTECIASVPLSSECNESSEALYARLKEVDPERADKIHPNDRRKILRSLDIYTKKHRPHSEFLKDQAKAGGVLSGPLRYRDAVIFWIQSDQQVLEERLDARVDKMIERGLIKEMLEFHKEFNESREKPNYELGIFQSIGFKEFHKYLRASDVFRESETGENLFKDSLSLMKQRTKRYSKYQVKWIMKRFLQAPRREVPPLYALDGTDLTKWDANVKDVALEIMDDYLREVESPRHRPLEVSKVERDPLKSFACHCGTICMTEKSWEAHQRSNKHFRNLKMLERKKKKEQEESKPDPKRQRTVEDSDKNEPGDETRTEQEEISAKNS